MINKRNLMKSTLAASFVSGALAVSPGIALADDEATVRAFYTDLLSGTTKPNLDERVRAIVAEDWKSTPQPLGGPGAEGMVKTLQAFGQLIPDLKWEPVEIWQSGDTWIVRGKATGTPQGPFLGIEPTGKSFEVMSIDVHTMEDGKFKTSYHVEDWATAMRQLTAQ